MLVVWLFVRGSCSRGTFFFFISKRIFFVKQFRQQVGVDVLQGVSRAFIFFSCCRINQISGQLSYQRIILCNLLCFLERVLQEREKENSMIFFFLFLVEEFKKFFWYFILFLGFSYQWFLLYYYLFFFFVIQIYWCLCKVWYK